MKFSSIKLLIACLLSNSAFAKRRNLRESPFSGIENFVKEPEFDLEVKDDWGHGIMDLFQAGASFFGEENSPDENTENSDGFFDGFFGGSGSFSSTFQSFSQSANGGYDSYTTSTHSGGDGEEPTTVKIEEHGVMGNEGETEVTTKTTKIYADGHSTENVEHKTLDKDASFQEIFDAYKDVIDDVTPQVVDLSKILGHKIGDVLNDAVNKFWEEVEGVDEAEILDGCDISKEELIKDFDDFNESYTELENKEDLKNDPETAEKFDKLTDNFAKLVSFKL